MPCCCYALILILMLLMFAVMNRKYYTTVGFTSYFWIILGIYKDSFFLLFYSIFIRFKD
ncbi:hypothetical protein F4703DRAFT_1883634, partial [Phycomyces blakesleeanus]